MRSRHKVIALALASIAVGLALAVLANYAIWGYYLTRPAIREGPLGLGDELVAFSFVALEANGRAEALPEREERTRRALAFCDPSSNECLEGRSLASAKSKYGDSSRVRELPPEKLELIGSLLSASVREAFRSTAAERLFPARGVVLLTRTSEGEKAHALLRTSELSNDRFGFLCATLRVLPDPLEELWTRSFYFEISGSEGLDWRIFWPASALTLFAVGAALLLRRERRQSRWQQRLSK